MKWDGSLDVLSQNLRDQKLNGVAGHNFENAIYEVFVSHQVKRDRFLGTIFNSVTHAFSYPNDIN